MLVQQGRTVARQWVTDEASTLPGFHSAYLAGSTNWLPDDAPLPASSDLDINVVLHRPHAASMRGKFVYQGVLLEVTLLSLEQIRSPELILSDYHLAGGLRTPGILLDPTGQLTQIQAAVARDFTKRRWVRRRCEHARNRVLEQLDAPPDLAPVHDQVIGWLFPTGITTHVLLVVGLKNPTVRNRYLAVRDLLAEYGRLAWYETLLELLGCAHMSRTRVEQHLAALTEVFDAATAVVKTPFSFASDISALARPIAIGGSHHLVDHGFHREAVFWIAVTYSRCMKILATDAPHAMHPTFDYGYQRLLADLGIASQSDLQRRRADVQAHLPRVWEVAESIMGTNPGITDEGPSSA